MTKEIIQDIFVLVLLPLIILMVLILLTASQIKVTFINENRGIHMPQYPNVRYLP